MSEKCRKTFYVFCICKISVTLLNKKAMKNLTLQIDKATFMRILSGEQKEERRNIYPYMSKRYVHFCRSIDEEYMDEFPDFVDCFDGNADLMCAWLWGADNLTPEQEELIDRVYIDPVEYTQLTIINGRRKNAPRMVIEVVDIKVEYCHNSEGLPFTIEWEGKEHPAMNMCYTLGKVLSCENVE